MADRLTQLQDAVSQQSIYFCNTIDFIGNSCSNGLGMPAASESVAIGLGQQMSQSVFICAKDIETLIDSLPNEDSSTELQYQSLKRLEAEQQTLAEELEDLANIGEYMLLKIRSIINDIFQAKRNLQKELEEFKKTTNMK
ncbi:mediator of RNA polymerase II transcription subunit 21-like [Teleopsis dalmanni]|uniref:mediator of RNA polymerase II transcription subunit 21-like n=1 Tax=Teleopsis dalmanni TaxID=139649 RepID=UPI000D32A308|nr:mediator of RNA polymerase II transcription subunit 21-like [Teleopsis dalmanni]